MSTIREDSTLHWEWGWRSGLQLMYPPPLFRLVIMCRLSVIFNLTWGFQQDNSHLLPANINCSYILSQPSKISRITLKSPPYMKISFASSTLLFWSFTWMVNEIKLLFAFSKFTVDFCNQPPPPVLHYVSGYSGFVSSLLNSRLMAICSRPEGRLHALNARSQVNLQ